MQSLKTLALAALTLTAMAFVGVISASAATSLEGVVLCKANEDPCNNGHFASGMVLHGVAISNPVFLISGATTIECGASNALANTTSLLAHGLITVFSWSSCEDNEGKLCNVTTNNLPYLFKGELTSGHNAYEVLVTKHAQGAGRPSWRIANCAPTDCSYGATTLLFDVLSDALGTILDVSQALSGEGGFCVFIAGVWHVQYGVHCLDAGGVNKPCWVAMESGSVLSTP